MRLKRGVKLKDELVGSNVNYVAANERKLTWIISIQSCQLADLLLGTPISQQDLLLRTSYREYVKTAIKQRLSEKMFNGD